MPKNPDSESYLELSARDLRNSKLSRLDLTPFDLNGVDRVRIYPGRTVDFDCGRETFTVSLIETPLLLCINSLPNLPPENE